MHLYSLRSWLPVLALIAASSQAWSCLPPADGSWPDFHSASSALKLAKENDHVFVGRVTHHLPHTVEMDGQYTQHGYFAAIQVLSGWLPAVDGPSVSMTYQTGGRCPPQNRPMEIGDRYLLFFNDDGSMNDWFPLANAERMVEALGPVGYTVRNGLFRYMHNKSLNSDADKAGAG